MVLTILKNMKEGLAHILWKIKHVPNHQPSYSNWEVKEVSSNRKSEQQPVPILSMYDHVWQFFRHIYRCLLPNSPKCLQMFHTWYTNHRHLVVGPAGHDHAQDQPQGFFAKSNSWFYHTPIFCWTKTDVRKQMSETKNTNLFMNFPSFCPARGKNTVMC